MSLLKMVTERADNSIRSAIDRADRVVTGLKERATDVLGAGIDRIDRGMFGRLFGAGILGLLAVLPYQLSSLEQQGIDVPISVVVIQALLINGTIIGTAVFIGLALNEQVELSVFDPPQPIQSVPGLVSHYGPPVALGSIAAGVVVVADVFGFARLIDSADSLISGTESISVWTGLLASLYGGITEEILLRLGLMTFVLWAVAQFGRTNEGRPSNITVWGVIVLTSIAFGIGHLPATATMTDLTPAVVTRALILNGIPGLVFGYCYWQRDLLAAMAAHLSADFILHVVTPLLDLNPDSRSAPA